LARFGLAEGNQDAVDGATWALVVGQHLVDGLGPIEADSRRMVRVDGTGSTAVAAGQHADPQHFAVPTERRVKLVGRDRLVQAVDAQQICRTGIVVVVVVAAVAAAAAAVLLLRGSSVLPPTPPRAHICEFSVVSRALRTGYNFVRRVQTRDPPIPPPLPNVFTPQ